MKKKKKKSVGTFTHIWAADSVLARKALKDKDIFPVKYDTLISNTRVVSVIFDHVGHDRKLLDNAMDTFA